MKAAHSMQRGIGCALAAALLVACSDGGDDATRQAPADASLADASADVLAVLPEAEAAGPTADASPDAVSDAERDAALGATDAEGPFCQAEDELGARCEPDGALCYAQNLANCDIVSAILSDTTRKAYVDCEENLQCVTGLDFLQQPCVKTSLLSAVPTPAQTNLAHDYCAVCAIDPNCFADFYENGYATGVDGPGFQMLQYNDDLVNFIDQRCLPYIPGDSEMYPCGFRFGVCIALALAPDLPVDNCKDGGP